MRTPAIRPISCECQAGEARDPGDGHRRGRDDRQIDAVAEDPYRQARPENAGDGHVLNQREKIVGRKKALDHRSGSIPIRTRISTLSDIALLLCCQGRHDLGSRLAFASAPSRSALQACYQKEHAVFGAKSTVSLCSYIDPRWPNSPSRRAMSSRSFA